ncbi:hypothetical protein OE810_04190 [Rhodobacteraceae bacterium XHP0102]|nr:hypothetical protein [Rhodobacteraceae bacterium XHP0102]
MTPPIRADSWRNHPFCHVPSSLTLGFSRSRLARTHLPVSEAAIGDAMPKALSILVLARRVFAGLSKVNFHQDELLQLRNTFLIYQKIKFHTGFNTLGCWGEGVLKKFSKAL